MIAHFGFSRHWCDCADFAAFNSVDNTTFTNVRISNEADRYLLFVRMKLGELSQQLNQGTLSEGVVGRSMESNRRIARGEMFNVSRLSKT